MDAMSHFGVARDVCAYLTHHQRSKVKTLLPSFTDIMATAYKSYGEECRCL
jgi:hypothetical protein